MEKYDLIIIGAGRGSNLAVNAGKKGLKVAIIEKSSLGGTCPNRGCVPSKLLIGYANVARTIKEAKRHFIKATIDHIDVEKIFYETNEYIKSIDLKYKNRFNENVKVYKGKAHFLSNHIIKVNDDKLTAPKIVIATGTRPKKAPYKHAYTSDDIFPLKKVPSSITIIGSGFIACELANFFDAVGIKTTQIVRGNSLLSIEDEDISKIFKNEYTKNVKVLFNSEITKASYKNNNFKIKIKTQDEEIIHESEALLYAIGRESNADLLNLEKTDIKVNEKGFIQTDEFFQTDAKGVYCVGDARGEYMLQHAASYEVNHLTKILLEDEIKPLKFKYMAHAVFSSPELASVGISQKEAIKEELNYICSITSWQASAKAMSRRVSYPRTKLLVNPYTYEILGCHLIGEDSATMIHQVLAILHIQNDIRHLKNMLYIHPALSEALLPAAVEVIKKIEEYKKSH